MKSAHTGIYIRELVDEVLAEWDIDPSRIIASLTDNGSNIIAAFRAASEAVDEEEDGDEQELVESDDDYDDLECDQAIAFSSLGRVSCFAHTLQLVINKFSEVTAFKGVLARSHGLIRRFNSSGKATEKLVALSGKKLRRDCPTRWSSSYLMIDHMLELHDPLTSVLEELEWDNLATSEWKLLDIMKYLLKPFAVFTALVQGEAFTTVSCVIPAIMDLSLHLEECKGRPEVSEAGNVLLRELKRRFKKYTDPGHSEHESLFIVATALDPRYRLILNGVQLDSAKQELFKKLKQVSKEKNGASSSSETESVAQEITVEDCEEPPTKRFKHLNQILEAKWKEGLKRSSSLPPGKAEIEQYFQKIQVVESTSESADPIAYWISREQQFPLLSSVAVDILTIPATSAPVERVFSSAGESTTGRRNPLSDANLEREVMLRTNRHFL